MFFLIAKKLCSRTILRSEGDMTLWYESTHDAFSSVLLTVSFPRMLLERHWFSITRVRYPYLGICSLLSAYRTRVQTMRDLECSFIVCCLVARSSLTLCDPRDYSLPGSSVHGISQARILEWVAISFSRESSWPRNWTQVSCIGRQILYHEPPEKPHFMSVCTHNPTLQPCRLMEGYLFYSLLYPSS